MIKPSSAFAVLLASAALCIGPNAAAEGPAVDLAPEPAAKAAPSKPPIALGAGNAPEVELPRGMTEQRFRAAEASESSTSIGGYGEFVLRGTESGKNASREWVADVSRLTLFVAHPFNDVFRVYTELEVEHAIACARCKGAVELEQAYFDWKVWGDRLGIRGGLILEPMGIINQWHEPPIYNGANRPRVETVLIPSTWRDLGLGFFGKPFEGVRYEVYGVVGLNPLGLSAGGLGGARQQGALTSANAWAAVGRLELEPILGLILGGSGYLSDAGPNAALYAADGARIHRSVPLVGYSLDARMRLSGVEWKVLFVEWHMPGAGPLMATYDAAGQLNFPDATLPLPTRIRGGYVEAGYNVFHPFGLTHQLVPFARIETYDTQNAVPAGYTPNPAFAVREYTAGVSYRPIQRVVFKADGQLRNRRAGLDESQINAGFGFMY